MLGIDPEGGRRATLLIGTSNKERTGLTWRKDGGFPAHREVTVRILQMR